MPVSTKKKGVPHPGLQLLKSGAHNADFRNETVVSVPRFAYWLWSFKNRGTKSGRTHQLLTNLEQITLSASAMNVFSHETTQNQSLVIQGTHQITTMNGAA